MQVAQTIGAYKFLECSARMNDGVREVFENATRAALLKKQGKNSGKKCKFL
jgi:Ras homolog gene family, member A